jgi:branched-subunit amino acid aminotransferase/4-amino-4-deoxychorismate lyase
MPEPLVYLNGRMVPASEAHLAIYDAGIVLGATVTEMTRTVCQRPWRLEQHLDRLFRSLRYTRMDIGLSKEELAAISQELVAHNVKLLEEADELGLIHFVTAGEVAPYAGSAGRPARLTPTVCAHTFPLPFELWARRMRTGVHLVTPSIRHVPPQCYDPKMKYRSRMHYYLADQEARLVDSDAMALLLDLAGNVTETSGANFLIVEKGTVVSPTTVNTLPGVSRGMVLQLCGKLGIPFVERDIQVYDVMNTDEAFLASTPYCLMPVTKINGVVIGDGRPGPMVRRLLAAWSEEVGLDIEKQIQERAARREAAKAQQEC